jgi:FdhD protein
MHGSSIETGDDAPFPAASVAMARVGSNQLSGERVMAEESPIAFTYDGTAIAVVMATPADLADLAWGFSLTEGIIDHADQIERLDIVSGADGIDLRMWLRQDSGRRFKSRQRRLVGPTGCGLCGIESLSEANRHSPAVEHQLRVTAQQIEQAVEALVSSQILNRETRATHAAGFYLPNNKTIITREDVGRHNALDKLAGALATTTNAGNSGVIVLTSRISVEMVQKVARIGAGVIIAISAPTALAVRTADSCGITLVGVARGHEFEVFTHPDAIALY